MSEFEPVAPSFELIGEIISVRWPHDGEMYEALVVGCQSYEYEVLGHKVFYVADGTIEVLDLSSRDWMIAEVVSLAGDYLGRRIAVWWEVLFEDEGEEPYMRLVPFEAFIVQHVENGKYRLFYTDSDEVEDRNMIESESEWSFCDPNMWYIDGCELISWSKA